MAVLAENLFVLAIPAIEASASRAAENDGVRNDIIRPSGESLGVPAEWFDGQGKALGSKHVTTLRVNRLSPVQTDHSPRPGGRIGTRVNCLTRMARFSPDRRSY